MNINQLQTQLFNYSQLLELSYVQIWSWLSNSVIFRQYFQMVLTQSQKAQLHKDVLEYLVNNQYPKTAQTFSDEAELAMDSVDPEGNKLQMKWKSILNLQKKINNLEDKVKSLEEELARGGGGNNNLPANTKIQDLYIPAPTPKLQLEGHRAPITSMSFHPSFTELATCSEDGTIKIWEIETGDLRQTLRGHTNSVNSVNYDKTGKYLASSSSDLTVRLWDNSNEYKCIKTFYGHEHNVSYVDFVTQGDYLLSCSRDKNIRLWEISTGHCKRTYKGHQGWVRKLAISADGKTFVSCSDDQTAIVWNIDKQTPILRFFAHEFVVENVLIIEGENSSVLVNSEFLKHKFTQQSKMAALKKLEQDGINGITSYQQTFIVTCSRDKLIRLFACHSGELLHTFSGHDNWVRCMALHPTGKYLYSVSDDKTLRVWELTYGKQKKMLKAHDNFISTVRLHPKYGVIATGGNDKVGKIWSLK